MAHQRNISAVEATKEPHSVSLKVLRYKTHPADKASLIPSSLSSSPSSYRTLSASLAYPSVKSDSFILSPLLTLPPAFGSAYVGDTFSCTLCANNELLPGSTVPKTISNVRIDAEMKIPSSTTPIPLTLGPDAAEKGQGQEEKGVDLDPSKSLQKLVSFDLKEEGSHVLAVTVTYTETTQTSGRVRTFRKLYQFVCKGCIVVRTKAGLLRASSAVEGQPRGRMWALEAQLENIGEETITLDMVTLETMEQVRRQGINWECVPAGEEKERPVLMPGDVQQLCFIVEELLNAEGEGCEEIEGRVVFGILSIGWRGPMGNRGILSTGSLGARSV